jgi:tRNA (cytidine/uridine-2'-O-)-methyltransferase
VRLHESWDDFLQMHGAGRRLLFSKKAAQSYIEAKYRDDDFLVFGPETTGLPEAWLDRHATDSFRIPMMTRAVRSLNLSNAVSIVVYEGLRQLGRLYA